MKQKTKRVEIPPRASIMIESMRDIGYSLQTAVADLIDNSITACARNIELLADTTSPEPAIGILDDGAGMSKNELLEAMRPGSRNPRDQRAKNDLGRFGLGLKTASFSQCRRVSVITRKNGKTFCAIWDIDLVAKIDKWEVETPDGIDNIPWSGKLESDGTLVVWQKLDRLVSEENGNDRQNLMRQIRETKEHIGLVFHRFLAGEARLRSVAISLNGGIIESFDPFNSQHPATTYEPEEIFLLGGKKIRIQSFTLPHHNKVGKEEWERYAGREGYIKNQGFYLYRGKRLIVHGTWFNIIRQAELTKLSRVRIDIPNGMDAEWKIDVKKASAQPPALVRDRLKRIIDPLSAGSKRVYKGRGARLFDKNLLPVWTKRQDKNQFFYGVNHEHPAFDRFAERLDDSEKREFIQLLNLVGATVPIAALVADAGNDPKNVVTERIEDNDFRDLVRGTYTTLRSRNIPDSEIRLMMQSAEPFRSMWEVVESLIVELEAKE